MQTHDEETRRFFKHSSVQVILCPRIAGKRHSWVKQKVNLFFFLLFFLYSYYLLIYFPFWGKKWEYFNEQLMARILVLTNHFYLLSDFCSSTWLCQENWQLNLYIFIFRLFWFWFNSKSTKSCLGIDRCNIEVCGVETWAFILKELSNLYFLVKKFVSRSGIDCWSGEMKSSFSWQWITIWKTDLF